MPVSVSYPGLYIEELPLSAHTIAAAPTSVAAFVGYTHPYKTKAPGDAVRIFGFSDYEAAFGGLYTSGLVDANVARAVYQFFLNGGSDAYVVGLKPLMHDSGGGATEFTNPAVAFKATVATTGGSIVFTAQELADVVPMKVAITNVRAVAPSVVLNTFDVVITYGSRIETYRGVQIGGDLALAPDAVINASSTLVQVAPGPGFGTALGGASSTAFTATPPAGFTGTFDPKDFTDVFQPDTPLDKVQIFNMLLTPGVSDNAVLSAALAFAERKLAFAIVDPPEMAAADGSGTLPPIDSLLPLIPRSQNGAIYFPYLLSTDPVTSTTISVPPSGYVAGVYARTDTRRGVWKAPAGLETTILNTVGPAPTGLMTDPRHGVLNLESVNVLRNFTGIGTVVFGARTLVADNDAYAQSKYVSVRRMTLFLEQTLLANLRWVVFEPNDEPLWIAIRTTIENFLLSLFNQGALQGSTPSQAFQVKCDATTTTADNQQNGVVNIVVAFAPLKPAEFVVIKIAQLAGQSAS